MEKNELCKRIKLRNRCCKICAVCIISFKHFMVAWSNFRVNWEQITIIQNGLLSYETRRCNSSDCIWCQYFRLFWANDKTPGDIFLSNLSGLLSGNAVAGCMNLVIDKSSYRWHLNIYVTLRVLYLVSSFLLVCCTDVFCLSFVFKQQCKHFRGPGLTPSMYVLSVSSFMALLQLFTIVDVQISRYWVCFPFSLLLTTGRSACKTGSSASVLDLSWAEFVSQD